MLHSSWGSHSGFYADDADEPYGRVEAWAAGPSTAGGVTESEAQETVAETSRGDGGAAIPAVHETTIIGLYSMTPTVTDPNRDLTWSIGSPLLQRAWTGYLKNLG